jgi:UDP-N-acetylmuramate dehydrogenase
MELAGLTTLGIGGPADVFSLTDQRELPMLAESLTRAGVRPVSLGWGSNVLVADAGVEAPVMLIRTRGITVDEVAADRVRLVVQAGHSLPDLVDFTVAEQLIGIETLVGVPGTVGAMPIQNVGAYGQETADALTHVIAWDWHLRRRVRMSPQECGLGHRTSRFKGSNRWTILEVGFELARSGLSAPIHYSEVARALGITVGQRRPVSEVIAAVLAIRAAKGMVLQPADCDGRSVGSVFLSTPVTAQQAVWLRGRGASPHTYPDGRTRVGSSWLLRDAGYRLGQHLAPGVRVSTKQYTLVAEQGATAARFGAAAAAMQRRVAEVTGVMLIFEPDLVGDDVGFADLLPHPRRPIR